jgi:cation:H+ antiporter
MTVFRWEGGLLLGYFVLYTTYTLLDATQHRVLEDFTSLVLWVIWPATGLTLAAATTVNLLRRDRAARPGTSRPE